MTCSQIWSLSDRHPIWCHIPKKKKVIIYKGKWSILECIKITQVDQECFTAYLQQMPKRDELETTSATFSFTPYKLLHTKCFVQVQIPVWFFLELFIAPLNKRNEIFILITATFTMPFRLVVILPTVAFHMPLSIEAAILILEAVILGWKADELWQNSKSNAHSCDLFCTTEKTF